jgi:iron complex transport system substrate-binding protein
LYFSKVLKLYSWREKLFGVILVACLFFPELAPFFGESSAEGLRITDDMGADVVLEGPARGIVSLYAGHTENLIAIGAKDFIAAVGRTGAGDWGLGVPTLGIKPGIEQVIALSADLVLTRPMLVRSDKAFYDALRSMGIDVLSIDPPSWENFAGYIGMLANITGMGDEPEKTAESLMSSMSAAGNGMGPGAFLVTNGKTMATCTPDSWAAHILKAAGFRNAAEDAAALSPGSVIAGYGAERLLASDGDIDVILLQQGAMNTVSAEEFMRDPRFSAMRAVRAGMVFDVSEADVSRPSLMRLRSGAMEELRKLADAGRD